MCVRRTQTPLRVIETPKFLDILPAGGHTSVREENTCSDITDKGVARSVR